MKNIFEEHSKARVQGFVLHAASGMNVRNQPILGQSFKNKAAMNQQFQVKANSGVNQRVSFEKFGRQQQSIKMQIGSQNNKDQIIMASKNSKSFMSLSKNSSAQQQPPQIFKKIDRRQILTNTAVGAFSFFGLNRIKPAFAESYLEPSAEDLAQLELQAIRGISAAESKISALAFEQNKQFIAQDGVFSAESKLSAFEQTNQFIADNTHENIEMFYDGASPVYKSQISPVEQNSFLIADSGKDNIEVYFGVGCFWHVQHEFVEAERSILGRSDKELTSWTGYAGGSKKGNPPDSACYHNLRQRNDYGQLGHGEVVQMQIPSQNYKQFAEVYAELFDKNGDRPDKGDRGPEYRHLVGIPGGVKSPLFKDLEETFNKRGIAVVAGKGDDADNLGKRSVWVMDLAEFPFYRAEAYHQYHDGFAPGENYPNSYNQLKDFAKQDGRLQTSKVCPDE